MYDTYGIDRLGYIDEIRVIEKNFKPTVYLMESDRIP
jgi:hypothetical protein